jgi:hypothetical protein
MFGCTSNGQDVKKAKANCYTDKLKEIKEIPLYKEAMSQFVDTFKVMKDDKRYFGIPEVVSNKIDEAIFFNQNKTECLLIVLQRNSYGLVFGSARIVRGTLYDGKWLFKPSMDYVYSKDYFNGYPENSFENISGLARYSVLTDGEVKKRGCEIDEYYWFVHLKR